MDIHEAKITEYLSALASSSPAPGGGSCSGLAGARGAALVSMVANLSTGRAKYADYQDIITATLNRTGSLIPELTECIHKDMTAFDGVMSALKMPKDTEQQKAERSKALQEAYKTAASVPAETAEKCLEVIRLAEGLLFKSNATAASDLSVAAIQARAGILTSLENVYVNLAVIRDTEYVARMQAWAESIDTESQKLLDIIRDGAAKMSGGK